MPSLRRRSAKPVVTPDALRQRRDAFEGAFRERRDALEGAFRERKDAFEDALRERRDALRERRDAFEDALRERRDAFEDDARFLRSWFERPLLTGSVTPSGKLLARTMASYVDPSISGPIIEIGPGTGPVTEALINRGIAPERLVLVEYNPGFCKLLQERFPGATVVCGDAYRLGETLAGIIEVPCAATISSLPLFTKPMEQRIELLQAAHKLMQPNAPFVQFTYAMVPPIPAQCEEGSYTASGSNRVWLNLPPARVWVYRKP